MLITYLHEMLQNLKRNMGKVPRIQFIYPHLQFTAIHCHLSAVCVQNRSNTSAVEALAALLHSLSDRRHTINIIKTEKTKLIYLFIIALLRPIWRYQSTDTLTNQLRN